MIGKDYLKEAARLHPKSREEVKLRNNEFALIDRVHEAEHGRLKMPPEPAHKLIVTLEDDDFTEEKYEVYDNYQKTVHHDEAKHRTRRAFTRFLCSSPLRKQTLSGPDGRTRRLGSFHQCYRLDGKLVAFGVLDLLPDCVSSVYFLYDESIHKYTPGKLGALHEIALALEDGYRWWYPGFYIHSCPKMRYKIDYMPQYILDPQALTWDKLTKDVLDLLDEKPFVSLYLERSKNKDASRQEEQSTNMPSQGKSDIGVEGDVQVGEVGDDDDDDDDDDDSDENSTSLFNSTLPGIASLSEVEKVDLDHIVVRGSRLGPLYQMSDLVGWDKGTISDGLGVKSGVADLVAALGTDCVDVLCLDLAPESLAEG